MRNQYRMQGFMPRKQSSAPYSDFTEKQLKAYLTKDDAHKILLMRVALGAGIAFFVMSMAWMVYYQVFVLLSVASFIVSGILWLIIHLGIAVPTDKQYDAWVEKRRQEELMKALQEEDLDDLPEKEREHILCIHGYAVPGIKDARKYLKEDILWKKGIDGIKRYSINVYTYILPLEHRIAAMTFHINAVNHADHSQNIGDHFYDAVVLLQTVEENEPVTIEEAEYLYKTKSFVLGTNDGKCVNVTIRSLPLTRNPDLPGFDFIEPDVEATIRKLRRYIRSIKERGA